MSLPERIARLSPEQRALLERRLRERRAPDAPASGAPASGAPVPLSSSQRLLWYADRLKPGLPLYSIPSATRLRGPLDVDALGRALTEVVGRHEALRTHIEDTPDGPVQRAAPPAAVPLPVRDVSGDPDPEAVARALVADAARRPFDLEAGPLVRALLVRLGDADHVLLVNVHHIVFDGWSRGVLYRELGAAYTAFVAGEAPDLPTLPACYADYVAWQAEELETAEMAGHLAYWMRHLANVPALDLPAYRPRPAVQAHRGGSVTFSLPPGVEAAARALARDERATPFMVYLAAFQALLHRYSGQEDFAVMTPVAGRARPEFEALVGYFVNTVAVRADLSGAPSFRTLVRRVRAATFDGLSHQDAPFERVVRAVEVERSTNRTPVAQVLFAWQNAPDEPLALPGVEATRFRVGAETSKFDLGLSLRSMGGPIEGHVTYDADLLDRDAAERLAAHYAVLLSGLLDDPDQEVAAVPLLTPDERRQFDAWNVSAQTLAPTSIPDAFRAQAARTPDAVALEDDGRAWTYVEVDAWSDRLAGRLQRTGVGLGAHVGVCAERSAEFVVGTLAVLKAGAAYVPLDPAYPAERLALMAEDAALSALLVGTGVRRTPPVEPALPLADAPAEFAPEAAPESVAVPPEAAAYVMYTSGSTGRPKGVVVPHRAVVHLVLDTDYVRLGPADRVAHLASPSFDAATFEVWGALLTGARLVVVPQDTVLDVHRLAETFRGGGVTTTFLTAALFNLLVREAPGCLVPLKNVLFGGERADPQAVRAALADPPERLINGYGPTETTTFASWHLVTHVPDDATSVPIGRPLAGTTLWVLNGHRQPVPVGVPGELYVGGAGVAMGYLGRPDLTADRFVPDPFSDVPGARMYRTGDRVLRLPDGTIDFLGRMDRQVKLRGFRIEPGEVEVVLRAHEAVADAVVTVEDGAGGPRLMAHVVPTRGGHADPAALRAHLRRVLPEPLVPSAVGVVAALPLTANGKVDRAALRLLRAAPELAPKGAALGTEAERHLADIWEDVLGARPTNRDDDFFDLGGHSLLAVQMLASVRRAFGHAPPLAALSEASTVRTFALRVQGDVLGSTGTHVFPMGGGGPGDPVLFVHGAEANSLQFVKLARLLGTDRPVYGTQGTGFDGGPIVHQSVEEIAAAYVEEWERLGVAGPVHLVGLCYGAPLALEMGRRLLARKLDLGSVIAINQPSLPVERARARGETNRPGDRLRRARKGLRSAVGRVVRGGLWRFSHWAGASGYSLATLRRRVPYVDRALAFEAYQASQTREQFIEWNYMTIVRADVEGPHAYPPDVVRDAVAHHQRQHVQGTYRRMVEAYEGHSFGGRLVMVHSDAHAEDPVSLGWRRLVGSFERKSVPGPHAPLYEPFVREVAACLRDVIDPPTSP